MRRSRFPSFFPWVGATVVSAAVSTPFLDADALPRYSARYEQNCTLCHVNPTGGGLRSLYASRYLVPVEMTVGRMSPEELERIQPRIGENLIVGADLRTLYAYTDEEDPGVRNFFQMQGDVYLAFRPHERFLLYFDRGSSDTYELFGMAYVLPFNGYAKVGRFVPAFGWKFDDHTHFTREVLGFFPPAHTDVGIELGFYPGRFGVHLSVLNGAPGSIMDENKDVALCVRAVRRFSLSGVAFGLGGSARHNVRSDGVRIAGGPLGYLQWKGLSWVGEVDGYRRDPSGGEETDGILSSHEVALRVRQGIELMGTYDLWDPDVDRKTGARQRFGGGIHVLVYPFLGVEALVRFYEFDSGPDLSGEDYVESLFQFHFLY